MSKLHLEQVTCPRPHREQERILLGHGGGGRLSGELIQDVFLPVLGNSILNALEDQAILALDQSKGSRLAVTTDAFVVRPLFFPGGDIASLAVHGTVNDLAVGGAIPRYLLATFILEEGLELDVLRRLVASFRAACEQAGVSLVAADTKVVERGKADQVFISTTGVGTVDVGLELSVRNAQPGDQIIVSGTIGDHGMAIMSVREGLEFETQLVSDSAPLTSLAQAVLKACPRVRLMRDPTRGGLSSTLHEIAVASGVGIRLTEAAIPIRREVRSACELLGLDPLYVANEGKLVAVVPAESAATVLSALQAQPLGSNAAIIGTVTAEQPRMVIARSALGRQRIVPMLAGEQLPRIC